MDQENGQKPKKWEDDIETAVTKLFRDLPKNERIERKNIVKAVAKKRGFYRGDPIGYFDPETSAWLPMDSAPEANSDSAPQFAYVINLYQAVTLILLSSIASTGIPGNIFLPANPTLIPDIQIAKQSKAIIEYERRMIDFFSLWIEIFELYATDGPILAYTRHARNGDDYGYTEKSVQVPSTQQIGGDHFTCPECQQDVPIDQTKKGAMGGNYCPNCGNSLEGAPVQPPKTMPSLDMQQVKEPNGRELVELFGVLETLRPFTAKKLSDHQWIGIEIEKPRPELAASFEDFADHILQEDTGTNDSENQSDRNARLRSMAPLPPQGIGWSSTTGASGGSKHLATYSRFWFRPKTFWQSGIEKETREKMLKAYPNGIFAQFVEGKLVGMNNESMEECLDLSYPLPGRGAYPPALCDNIVPVNEGLNDAYNLTIESINFASFPPVIVDESIVSTKEIKKKKMRPAELHGVEIPSGKDLTKAFFQVQVKDTSAAVQNIIQESFKWADFLAGAGGALRGGGVENTRTAAAYNQARNQNLQRLSIPFQQAKILLASIEEKLVNKFAANRTQNEVFAVVGKGGKDWEQRTIDLTLGRGQVHAYSEDSETIPTTWAQKQAIIQKMLDSQNPIIQALLQDPNNAETIMQTFGVSELVVPGKEEREKTLRRIDQLLLGEPQQGQPVTPQPVLINGVVHQPPAQPGPMMPSVAFNPAMDNPAIQLAVIRNWDASEAAQAIDPKSPGYQNVLAYANQCMQALAPPPPPPGAGQRTSKGSKPNQPPPQQEMQERPQERVQ